MIDLNQVRDVAADGAPTDIVTVSRRWLSQVLAEITNGREAAEKLTAQRRAMLDVTPVTSR